MIYAQRGTKNLPANNRVLNLYVVHNGRRQQGFQNLLYLMAATIKDKRTKLWLVTDFYTFMLYIHD